MTTMKTDQDAALVPPGGKGGALGEGHDSFLGVGALVGLALPALGLALRNDRVDALHLGVEQHFNRFFDLL